MFLPVPVALGNKSGLNAFDCNQILTCTFKFPSSRHLRMFAESESGSSINYIPVSEHGAVVKDDDALQGITLKGRRSVSSPA